MPNAKWYQAAVRYPNYALLIVLAFWLSLYLAWNTLSAVNFLYPVLYNRLDIGTTIAQYGPVNRYKRGFETTTRDERIRLFGAIVEAVNHDGRGLAQIQYYNAQGRPLASFLREPEIVHLQDVANLLHRLRVVSYFAAGLLLIVLAAQHRGRLPGPGWRGTLITVAGIVVTASGLIAAYGPVAFFYKMHTLVFPAGHQWFFYYYESLMTTLMKAPDIFGYIAALLIVLTGAYFAAQLWLIRRFLNSRSVPGSARFAARQS